MLRTLNADNKEVFIKEIEMLEMIYKYRDKILSKIGDLKLDYSYSEETLYENYYLASDISNFKDSINILELLFLKFNITMENENIIDTSINYKYINYLYDKFEKEIYDPETVLDEFYNDEDDEYVDNEGCTSAVINEALITSKYIDSLIDIYGIDSDEVKMLLYFLPYVLNIVSSSDNYDFDIRTKNNKYFIKNTFCGCKYQICCLCSSYHYSYSAEKDISESIEKVFELNDFIESKVK